MARPKSKRPAKQVKVLPEAKRPLVDNPLPRKFGRPSNKEIEYVKSMGDRMHPSAIALQLNRPEAFVVKILLQNVPTKITEDRKEADAIKAELRHSSMWEQLKKELTPDEIDFFEDEVVAYIMQFKGDVLHTERNVIYKSVKYGVMMNRNIASQRKDMRDIEFLERSLQAIDDKYESIVDVPQKEQDRRDRLEMKLEQAYASKQAKTKEYVQLEEKQQKLFNDLKANRDQRDTKFETANIDFIGLLKELAKKDKREQEDRQQALSQKVLDQERARLAKPYKFADGSIDQPLLNATTVMGDEVVPDSGENNELEESQ